MTDFDQTLTALTDPMNVQFFLVDEDEVVTAAANVHDGAMIAFVPSTEDLIELTLPDGEPLEQLHCTAIFLGAAADIDDDTRAQILRLVGNLAVNQPIILGDIFSFNVFNPDGSEPCLVVGLSGGDLDDAHDSVVELLDDDEIAYPDQHEPWIPHITLQYDPDPRRLLTDDLMSKTGPVTFDRIRVAFGGVTTDFPLGGSLTASHVFHLPGKHDQSTHAGHATVAEAGAAQTLAHGGKLDESDPENARVAGAVRAWTEQGGHSQLNYEIQGAMSNPDADTPGAAFARTVAAASPGSPELHRGMKDVSPRDIPSEGDVFDLGPTSFTRSKKVMEEFATPNIGGESSFGVSNMVHIKVKKGSRTVQVSQYAPKQYSHEQEHVGMGRYRVTSHSQKTVTVKARDGRKKTTTLHEIEIEQIDFDVPTTRSSGAEEVRPQGWESM